MNLLSFMDKLYENEHFATILIIAIVILVILFVIVLILGLKDATASKNPKKQKEEDVKDITFDKEENKQNKEDVTFETPVLTKNLEDFKKSFEEEIKKDSDVEVRTTTHSSLSEATKPVKILDINVIEDTAVMTPIIEEDEKVVTYDVDKKEIFKSKKEPLEEKKDDNKLHFIDDDGL